jgi:hypothetical protein
MKASSPHKWKRIPLSDRASLPTQSGLYAVLNWRGEILYIGKSVNLRSRWQNHHRYPQAKKLLWAKLAYLERDEIDKSERELIKRYQPPWNGSPVPSERLGIPELVLATLAIACVSVYMPQLKRDLLFIWDEVKEEVSDHLITTP